MDLQSSLIAKYPGGINRTKIEFVFQVFYSNTPEFRELDSIIFSEMVAVGEEIEIIFHVKNSPNFLRIDPGSFFSIHKNLCIEIAQLNQQQETVKKICCNPDKVSMFCHEIHTEVTNDGTWMVCGYDPHYVFKNPYSGCDISIIFNSQIIIGI